MASSDEREIRDAVVARLRELLPSARIVHELNVAGTGTNRIDVAAINVESIVGVEIKSKKDTLTRLDEQWKAFRACCHHVIVAVHEKHFVADPNNNNHRHADLPPVLTLDHPEFVQRVHWNNIHVWRYPKPDQEQYEPAPWSISRRGWAHEAVRMQPRAVSMLEMLWATELRAECARHGLASGTRLTRPDMIMDMAWNMTGKEICHAVCRQLRMRDFAEADAPIGVRQAIATPPQQLRLVERAAP